METIEKLAKELNIIATELFIASSTQTINIPPSAPIKKEPADQQYSDYEQALIEKYRRMKNHEKDTMHKVADTIAPDDEQAATFAKGC